MQTSLHSSAVPKIPKTFHLPLAAGFALLLASCSDSPHTCFDHAVLNCNMLHGFASRGMERELESPSVKLTDPKTGATAPMTRKEVVDDKIAFIDQSLAKVRQLRQNDDNRDMVQASLALYEYVLPVYQNEYRQLANLYDTGAPKPAIQQFSTALPAKYGAHFRELSDRLTNAGKAYASRHGIQVVWDIQTAPSQ